MVQWNEYDPGAVGVVKVAVPPAGTLTSKPPLESAVTVCITESLFTTVTCAPGETVNGPLKAKLMMVIVFAAAAGALPPPAGIEDIDDMVEDAAEDAEPAAPAEDPALELEQAAAPARAKA